ncbi:MAG: helix-turn-helix domain-containing protein [Candidatus Hadarchaeales archaeon]
MSGFEESFEEIKRKLGGKRGEELAEEILGILSDGTSHSLKELVELTKTSKESVKTVLNLLEEMGFVEREYRLTEFGRRVLLPQE